MSISQAIYIHIVLFAKLNVRQFALTFQFAKYVLHMVFMYICLQYLLNEEACDIPTLAIGSYKVMSCGKTFTWRVLLHWVTAHDESTAFSGTQNFTTHQGKLYLHSKLYYSYLTVRNHQLKPPSKVPCIWYM